MSAAGAVTVATFGSPQAHNPEFIQRLLKQPCETWEVMDVPTHPTGRPAGPLAGISDRAQRLAALGDPARLAIVDELAVSDRTPGELCGQLGLAPNLVAHHLGVLTSAGVINRRPSGGDRRRRYIHLVTGALDGLLPAPGTVGRPALFVCTHNSARSQLAAALWRQLAGVPASSAGTQPAHRVHPAAVAAAHRAGLDIGEQQPTVVDPDDTPELVVTVCDQAHEDIGEQAGWVHWSVPDPVPDGRPAAFDATVNELRGRIHTLLGGRAA